MDAKDIRNLSKAYMEVYDTNEEQLNFSTSVDEGMRQTVSNVLFGKIAKTKPSKPSKNTLKTIPISHQDPWKGNPETDKAWAKSLRNEDIDVYDIILSHLLDEGYADTLDSAEKIMVNMSEEWREKIVEKFISPFKGRSTYNNPQGLSPAMKAGHKSDELQRTEPGSERQKKQTRRSQQLDRLYHSARTAHLPGS